MVYFLQDWIVNPMLNLLKRTMTYPGFEPGTFGVAVSISNHCKFSVEKAKEKLEMFYTARAIIPGLVPYADPKDPVMYKLMKAG
jgi:hypothetical protein